jgi:hypothetical protein
MKMKKLLITGIIIILAGTSLFSGCVEQAEAKGILRLQITDKPAELKILYANVTISMIQVHKSGADEPEEEYENTDELDDDFIAYANGPYEAEVLQDIQFLGDAEGGTTPYNWSWDFGDGNISNEEDPLHNYSSEGLYVVNLTVTDDDGNGAEDWYVTTARIGEDDDETDAGWQTVVEDPQTFDLIALLDVKEELGLTELPVGKYTQIRLTVEEANITIDTEQGIKVHDLVIPSKKVKLIKPFWIYEDDTTVLTLDFDVHKSVHVTGNDKYLLKPTIKVIQE